MNDSLIPPNDKKADNFSETISPVRKDDRKSPLKVYALEFAYQFAVMAVLLVFFSFNMDQTEVFHFQDLFAPYKLAFFANYLVAAMIINYVLLPVLYYKKRMFLFLLAVSLLITMVVLMDEYVLEKIYFPDTRGTYFPGLSFTIVETLPIIIIMVAFKIAWDFNRKQREVEELKSLMKESEIQFLKSQINPHFLFNNLNSIYAYAIDYSPKTPSIILDLSTVLRYMLYDCREDQVALTKEVDHLKKYTALFELQLNKRGRINFREEIPNDRFFIPPLILIVFVENAFKHSTGSQAGNIEIDIAIHVTEDGTLTFNCCNNYSPHYQSTDTARGIGLQNVIKRLDLLFQKTYHLVIKNDGNLYTVNLMIPLKKM
ncbi:sensor histidine kinase [Algoriphagus resistens]|uniref:sensor histidine kinase n=1 Tax=Algoriphagus resistens TaxID=1750590 RepID=UPI001E614EB6|nr:histidine kinase [Algoriphagus resistens]